MYTAPAVQKDREAVVADLAFAMRRISSELQSVEDIDRFLATLRDASYEIETLANDCRALTALRPDEFAPILDALVQLLNTITEW